MGALRAGLGGVPGLQNQSIAQTINGSLRFDGSNDYLSKTPSIAGNRTTWTWAGWVKKTTNDERFGIFGTGTSDINWTNFFFDNLENNTIRFRSEIADVVTCDLITQAIYRDPLAWYHLVFVLDATSSISNDRVKIYINGVRQTLTIFTAPGNSSSDYLINTTNASSIGARSRASFENYLDGYLSNVYFIDGQALGPGFFGFTDSLTGTWRPKRLKDGDATVNDGTVWSGDLTATTSGGYFNASYPATNAFNGNLASSAVAEPNDGEITWAPSGGLQVNGTIEIYRVSNPGTSLTASVNGGRSVNFADGQWVDLGFSGNLRTLVITASGGQNPQISGIRVDGVVLIDSTTTNVDFGTNGFYLPLDDQDDYTTDRSGKGNNWTANGFTGDFSNPDVVPDSPSGVVGSTKPTSGITTTSSITKPTNYATLNPLNNGHANAGGMTLSNGNLSATNDATQRHIAANMAFPFPSRGKFYFEMTPGTQVASPVTGNVGFGDYNVGTTAGTNSYINFYTRSGAFYIQGSGFVVNDGAYAFGDGDTIGCAIDFDSNIVNWYRNGSLQQSLSFPAPTVAVWPYYISYNSPFTANFGQRPFKFAPPDGYLTLCSANARPSTVITRPDQYFGVTTYSGNGGTQTISGFNFSPDLVWLKRRTDSDDNSLQDTVRGAGNNRLRSNSTNAENTQSGQISSFNSDGWTMGDRTNQSGKTYVAWCWKAGGPKFGGQSAGQFWKDGVQYASAAAAGLTAGANANLVTGASVGTKQGFSIIGFDASAQSSAAVELPHGLGKTPGMIIVKSRDSDATGWYTWHRGLSNLQENRLFLNGTNAEDGNTSIWNNTAPTNTTFWVGGDPHNNDNCIAYVWADVPGVQKFGNYQANASADGPYIELGFRPSVIIIKAYSGTNAGSRDWVIYDSERDTYNTATKRIRPNSSGGELSYGNIDFLSNGFKIRIGSGTGHEELNESGNSYIYSAWAEAPSFNLYGGQSNAR